MYDQLAVMLREGVENPFRVMIELLAADHSPGKTVPSMTGVGTVASEQKYVPPVSRPINAGIVVGAISTSNIAETTMERCLMLPGAGITGGVNR
jgi:hypothetical protein